MTNEELLIEAKQRYPIGTKFISISDETEITVNNYYHSKRDNCIYSELSGNGGGRIWSNGKWAKLLNSIEQPQIINNYDLF